MPRISFPVDSPTLKELKQFLPWGMQCEVYRQLTKLLLEAVKTHGNGITGLLMHGEVKLVAKEEKP